MGLQLASKKMKFPDAGMRPKWALLVLIGMLLNSGCAPVMMPVTKTDDSPVNVSIAIGDTVRVLTKHGDRPTFKVTEITEQSLIGKDRDIPYADMAFVEKRVSGSSPEGHATAVTLGMAAGLVFFVELFTYGGAF